MFDGFLLSAQGKRFDVMIEVEGMDCLGLL
jgi:hypothetical protein